MGQLPQEHLSFLQLLLNFTITKYFIQEVNDDPRIYVDERSPCDLYNWRYKDLSMPHHQKVMVLLPAVEKCLPAPLTRDKEICHMIVS